MSIKAKILEDMKEAVKSGDRLRRTVTRMLLSELNYAESSLPSQVEIDELSSLQVINNYYKKLLKNVSNYPDSDHRSSLQQELAIVEQYLPRKITPPFSRQALMEA